MSKKRRKGFYACYKGYSTHFAWNREEQVYVGTVEGATETEEITVKGKTTDDTIYKYCDAIDRHLEK